MKKAHKKTAPKKGPAGKKTGVSTRSAIRTKRAAGLSLDEIGAKVNRDGATIGAIASGNIKNPPHGLAGRIRSIKTPAKRKKSKR